MTSQDYWRKREQANIARLLKKNIDYEKAFRIIYSENYRDISLRIDALYRRYGDKNGEISLAEVKAIANKTDVEALAATVKRLTKDNDYSDYANNLMARYNLKMQVSRLELLRDEINIELVKNSVEITNFMANTLTDEARSELKRQAGILGSTLETLDAKALKTIVNGSFGSATFSERLWGNTQYLANNLNTLLTQSIINGRHPNDVARALRRIFDVNQKQAERLMRTESARVHAECAVKSMEKNGVTWYEWVAEPSACEICAPLDGKVFEVKGAEFGNVKHPLFPLHPNCRCATIPAVKSDKKDAASEKASDLLKDARQAEPKITSDLKDSLKSTSAHLEGLDYRLKTLDSLSRKVKNEPKAKMRDVVRYTSISKPDELVADYSKIMDNLRKKGYNISAVKNSWLDENRAYKGINTNLKTPAGYEFELQFHTQASFDLKNGKLHELYEKQRVLDKVKDRAEIDRLEKEMLDLSSKLKYPQNIGKVK
ncbi:hypothetical protein RyT2_15050 [Pseudolactococcus yaeyamensis]